MPTLTKGSKARGRHSYKNQRSRRNRKERKSVLYVKTDGSYSPECGGSTGAWVMYMGDRLIKTMRFQTLCQSSMEAEYTAFLDALTHVKDNYDALLRRARSSTCSKIRFYTDSRVLVRHLTGSSANKTPSLQRFARQVAAHRQAIETRYGVAVEVYWIPRSLNLLADALCKSARCFS